MKTQPPGVTRSAAFSVVGKGHYLKEEVLRCARMGRRRKDGSATASTSSSSTSPSRTCRSAAWPDHERGVRFLALATLYFVMALGGWVRSQTAAGWKNSSEHPLRTTARPVQQVHTWRSLLSIVLSIVLYVLLEADVAVVAAPRAVRVIGVLRGR